MTLCPEPRGGVPYVSTFALNVKHLLSIVDYLIQVALHDPGDLVERPHDLAGLIIRSLAVPAVKFMNQHFVLAASAQLAVRVLALRVSCELRTAVVELFRELEQELRDELVLVVKGGDCAEDHRVFIAERVPREAALLRFQTLIVCRH